MSKTIEISRELVEYAAALLEQNCPGNVANELRALLAAPAVERQAEPVTMDGKTTIREYVANSMPDEECGDDWTKGYEECKRRIHAMFIQPINTSPPAPVAVVLPTMLSSEQGPHYSDNRVSELGYLAGYNACLDKIKELNP